MSWVNGAWMDDTYTQVIGWCPVCRPDEDLTGLPWEMIYCEPHAPDKAGKDDRLIDQSGYIVGGGEAGGPDNIAFNNLINRPQEAP